MIQTRLRYPQDAQKRDVVQGLAARLLLAVDAGDDGTGKFLVQQIKLLGGVFIEERSVTLTHNGIKIPTKA